MKIKYVLADRPDLEKVYDTELALKRNRFIVMSQERFDKLELARMKADKERGLILNYEVIEDEQEAEPNEQNHDS